MGNEAGKGKRLDIQKKAMAPDLEKEIIKMASTAARICKTNKEKAEYIKLELDDKFRGPWNVVVGPKFGGIITHIPDHFIYFGISGTFHLVYSTRHMKASSKGHLVSHQTGAGRAEEYISSGYYD